MIFFLIYKTSLRCFIGWGNGVRVCLFWRIERRTERRDVWGYVGRIWGNGWGKAERGLIGWAGAVDACRHEVDQGTDDAGGVVLVVFKIVLYRPFGMLQGFSGRVGQADIAKVRKVFQSILKISPDIYLSEVVSFSTLTASDCLCVVGGWLEGVRAGPVPRR